MNETMKKDNTANMAAFKLMLLVLMVLQNSSTVLVGRYTRSNGSKESLFVVNHLVMITEVGKVRTSKAYVCICILLLLLVFVCILSCWCWYWCEWRFRWVAFLALYGHSE